MTARLDSVCKYICEAGGWKVSNLQLQKILYLAQVYHLGKTGNRLADARFQAWDYGPVEPTLYNKAKVFGASPVENVFYDALTFKEGDPRRLLLDEICDDLLERSPGNLIDVTHWEEGAWAKYYVPGVRGVWIPDEAIRQEYIDRARAFGPTPRRRIGNTSARNSAF